jgi:hypothetical protein
LWGSSPVGVPPRLLPKGVVVPEARLTGQGFLRRGRSVWSISSPQPGGADLAQFERVVTPAPACPSPASTSRAGHSAGRLMPEPPENGVYGPARRHRTRPNRRGVPSPAASLVSEIRGRCNRIGDDCQAIVAIIVTMVVEFHRLWRIFKLDPKLA